MSWRVTWHGRAPLGRDRFNVCQNGRTNSRVYSPESTARRANVRVPDSQVPIPASARVGVVIRVADVAALSFCFVCHAHDSTGEPPLPQLDVPSNSQVTLPSPLVRSSLSGMLPTLAELDTYGSSARRAASDIPRAHRMVVPATVYTWHTAAQVLRPASDMPHGSGRRTCPRGRRADHP